METMYLSRIGKPDLAYVYSPGEAPLVMFCGGFKSDMTGSKATYLQEQCAKRGQAYLRFDYSGHGASGGEFKDGTIGSWFNDALGILTHIDVAPFVLVGSSMGGWIALLVALARKKQIKGLIGVAAAPDFTGDLYENQFSDAQRRELDEKGYVQEANEYSDEPYIFTRALIDDGKQHFLLNTQHKINFPMHLLQGKNDSTVHWKMALNIQRVFGENNVKITMIEDGDHSLSRPQDLQKLDQIVQYISGI